MLTFVSSSTYFLQVLSLRVYRKTTMALSWFSRLALIILTCIPRPSLGCPSGCRCYSLTVECGSLGLKEIPQGVPSVTEVSCPPSPTPPPPTSVVLCQLTPSLIHSYYPEMIVVNQFAVTLFDVSLREGLHCWLCNYSFLLRK